ncbi:hypothetical protein, partial [Actinocorallia lasiicapitis]
ARAGFTRFTGPALATLREYVVAPIGGGRGADVVVRAEAAKAGLTALYGLKMGRQNAVADRDLCRALGLDMDSLIIKVRKVNTSLAGKPSAKAARAAGKEATALEEAAAKLRIRLR